jgi:hypothetical protein
MLEPARGLDPMPRWISFVIAGAALAITAVSAWFYVGPYAWLAELQLAVLGAYSAEATFLVVWIALMAPPIVLAGRWFAKQPRAPIDHAKEQDRIAREEELVGRFQQPVTITTIGIGLLVFAAVIGSGGRGAGEPIPFSVADLERGAEPSSLYVDLSGGTALTDNVVEAELSSYYVPLTSAGRVPVTVFVRTLDPDAAASYRGVLERDALPGHVRTEFERAGLVGDHHWMLREGHDPARDQTASAWLAAAGLALTVGGAAFIALRTRRRG